MINTKFSETYQGRLDVLCQIFSIRTLSLLIGRVLVASLGG